jgi:hypothetical protein
MLLLNVTNPDVVTEMTRLARPGGVVALQEPPTAQPGFATLRIPPGRCCAPRSLTSTREPAGTSRAASAPRACCDRRAAGRPGPRHRQGHRARRVLPDPPADPGQPDPGGDSCRRPPDPRQARRGPSQLREKLSEPGTLTCLPTIWPASGSKPSGPRRNSPGLPAAPNSQICADAGPPPRNKPQYTDRRQCARCSDTRADHPARRGPATHQGACSSGAVRSSGRGLQARPEHPGLR